MAAKAAARGVGGWGGDGDGGRGSGGGGAGQAADVLYKGPVTLGLTPDGSMS